MDSMFSGPKAKIDRANQHIHELHGKLQEFFNAGACKLHVEQDSEGFHVLVLDSQPMPKGLSLIVGDAIHNQRAALDFLAWEIVVAAGGVPTDRLYFPIRRTQDAVRDIVQNGELKIAGEDIWAIIIDSVKPYLGGSDLIWALHQLDIQDKHRLLIPVVSVTQLRDVCAYSETNKSIVERCTLNVKSGGRLAAFATEGEWQITNYGHPTFAVLFPAGSVLGARHLVQTLWEISGEVLSAIDAIERTFLSRRNDTTGR